jgi:hypothetical protein
VSHSRSGACARGACARGKSAWYIKVDERLILQLVDGMCADVRAWGHQQWLSAVACQLNQDHEAHSHPPPSNRTSGDHRPPFGGHPLPMPSCERPPTTAVLLEAAHYRWCPALPGTAYPWHRSWSRCPQSWTFSTCHPQHDPTGSGSLGWSGTLGCGGPLRPALAARVERSPRQTLGFERSPRQT